jgi:hypothetical protein
MDLTYIVSSRLQWAYAIASWSDVLGITEDCFAWIAVLIATFAFTIVEHLAMHHAHRRPHHRERLIQECFAKHQYGYFSFFLIALISINLDAKSLLGKFLIVSGLVALTFWTVGLVILSQIEEAIQQHGCLGLYCKYQLPPGLLITNKRMAKTMAILTLLMIVALSYWGPGAI